MKDLKAYNAAAKRRQYYRRKDKIISLLGGRCAVCGSQESLETDHIDPSTKSFTITDRLGNLPWKSIESELQKCQLLCHSCHKEKNKVDNGEAQHGSISMYRHHRCRCEPCRQAIRLKSKEWSKTYKENRLAGVV